MAELTKAQKRALLQDIATVSRRHGVDADTLKQIVGDHDLPVPPPPKFATGDRVAWDHRIAGFHGHGSIVPVDTLQPEFKSLPAGTGLNVSMDDVEKMSDAEVAEHNAKIEQASGGLVPVPTGTIVDPANKQNTTWIVAFDKEHLDHPRIQGAAGTHPDVDKLTLTSDELVKVEED